jgi:hypothetical protein
VLEVLPSSTDGLVKIVRRDDLGSAEVTSCNLGVNLREDDEGCQRKTEENARLGKWKGSEH